MTKGGGRPGALKRRLLNGVAALPQPIGIAVDRFGSSGLVTLHQWGRLQVVLGENGGEKALIDADARQLRFDGSQMSTHIQAIRFSGLRHQVADVELWGTAALNGTHQLRHQQVGQQ